MKVLMINSVCGTGSTGRICMDIAERLTAEGHECKIAYGRNGNVPDNALPYAKRIGTDWDVKVHALITRLFDAHGFASRRATKEFVKWMKAYDPDIIHLHNLHGYYLHIGVLFNALKEMNKPVVWTLHDCWAFTGHCVHYTAAGCQKWRTHCHHCNQKKTYPVSLLMNRAQKNYQAKNKLFNLVENLMIVTPSDWLSTQVRQSFLGKWPVQTLHNGIDPAVFHSISSDIKARYGLQGKKIVLGVSSIWYNQKGLADMIQLSQLLDDDHVVVMVGLSPEQKEALPDSVIGITRTESAKELAEIYTAADVFVNPTYEDTYPTVNLESQACGTPVITYRAGGSVESAHPDCVVEPGDILEIAKIIKSDAAKCRKDLQLDRRKMAQQYLELYKGLV